MTHRSNQSDLRRNVLFTEMLRTLIVSIFCDESHRGISDCLCVHLCSQKKS